MFDKVRICVRGGNGGAGSLSFRREKYVPKGGPDGGDGAPGGDVVLVATRQRRDLAHFRHRRHFRAGAGGHGQGGRKHGSRGRGLEVEVPVGTEVLGDGVLLADLVHEGDRVVVARGGEGGRGNSCFKSSTSQAPRFAEKGLPGEERWIELSLKLIADVGLVGLPNAGKSSLLAALTRARPRIAPYPFTTLEPNLGVLTVDDTPMVVADIPGLVEGASEGAGLGHRFLAHVERTLALVYVVDGSQGTDEVRRALVTVRRELEAFAAALVERPAVVAVNKSDLVAPEEGVALVAAAEGVAWTERAVVLSAETGEGVGTLVEQLGELVSDARREERAVARDVGVVLRPGADRVEAFAVERDAGRYRVRGAALERIVAKADLENPEALAYLQEVIERAGLNAALRRSGAQPGDTVVIGDMEFEFS
jgi:GTP-binding protein